MNPLAPKVELAIEKRSNFVLKKVGNGTNKTYKVKVIFVIIREVIVTKES